ncbi:alpha-N-acetylglucosaminidase [uncultured Bacteroides sp.]|uniref:alpha-N-acetylglucosaminidase n=2 Tax=uncultured Bacteroides sp. TaxID=162156 RepID=UPI0035A68042
MKTYIYLLLGICLMCSCTNRQASSAEALASRVTEGTSNERIIFRTVSETSEEGKDFFEIGSENGKVLITGNSDISLATGLNWYLKYVAGIHLSWNNLTQPLPDALPLPPKTIRKETSMRDRYYLNYCTYSYSTAFWDWARWEKEIDWMALHGVNMPLSMVGMEVVWYNLLKRVGYTTDEINAFISGPAYRAWWQMNNLEGWGGPNPDSWYQQQEALQKKIVARMRELGIEPVFPGYAGMVPRNIGEKLGYNIADPGTWCGFPRPAFLSSEDEHFEDFAAMYYEELEKLFGKTKYYSMDPFHEGGNTQGVDLAQAGTAIMKAMKTANPDAEWIIQAWQANPRPAMIDTLNAGDLLVLDLYSDKRPQWGDPNSEWCREKGFGKHDWLYCMLLNFGGNVGLHGRMNQMVNGFYDAQAHPNGKTLRGVGAAPEGIENNPVMFELIFELPWREERFTVDEWLQEYLKARYGGSTSSEIAEAWRALEHTVYNAPKNSPGEGTLESLLCARPGFHLNRTSTWGYSRLFYSPDSTAKAARLMLEAADKYKGNNNFEYDLVDIVRQSLTDKANYLLNEISQSYDRKDQESFRQQTQVFLDLIVQQDRLLSVRKEFSVLPWLAAARSQGTTEEEKDLYEWNASALITVWGDSIAANYGGLHDYAHREWSGILKSLYYKRWKIFFDLKQQVLEGKKADVPIDFYPMEKAWTERRKTEDTVSGKQESAIDVAKSVFFLFNHP